MTLKMLRQAEKRIQFRIFVLIIFGMFVYLILGISIPFIGAGENKILADGSHQFLEQNDNMTRGQIEQCNNVPPFGVFGAYGGFVALSSFVELIIHLSLRSLLRDKDRSAQLCCNFYLIIKWLLGQLANLVTYMHILFIAQMQFCIRHRLQIFQEQAVHLADFNYYILEQDYLDNLAANTDLNVLIILSIVYAIITGISLVLGNFKRARLIYAYIKIQPQIHKLQPYGFRNIQLARIVNFQSSAVQLQSTSLSEYMIDQGGPIVPGESKVIMKENFQTMESIEQILLGERLKYQDFPMLLVLIAYYITSLNYKQIASDQILTLIYIGVTILSLISGYTSSLWKRDCQVVNLGRVIELIHERQRKDERKQQQEKEKEKEKEKEEAGKDQKNDQQNQNIDDKGVENNVLLQQNSIYNKSSDDQSSIETERSGVSQLNDEVLEIVGHTKEQLKLNDTQKNPLLNSSEIQEDTQYFKNVQP